MQLGKAFPYLAFIIAFTLSPLNAADIVALKGATIFPAPDAAPIANGVVLYDQQRIIAIGKQGEVDIPAGAKEIDLTGKFLTAGFWNSHVHHLMPVRLLDQDKQVELQALISEQFLRWGFANVIDTGSDPVLVQTIKQRINAGLLKGPQIMIVGGSFVPVGGSPFYIKPVLLAEFKTTEQTKALVTSLIDAELDDGIDGIKLFTGSWATADRVVLMNPDHVKAATTIAHQAGLPVFAHPSDSEGAAIAINGGADVLAHTFPAELKGPWNRALPAQMAQASVALTPTLKLFRVDLERIGLPAHIVDLVEQNAIDQTAAVKAAGATILFGTDVGYMSDSDTREEFRLMAAAGLGFADILESLTIAPARIFQLGQNQGKVLVGYRADFTVMASDPRASVAAFADIEMTIRSGEVIYSR